MLREQYPCYWSPGAKLWILSRYDDVQQAAQDWESFSSTQGNMIDELPGRAGGTLGTTDPPRHDRLRALAQSAFLKRNIAHLIPMTLEIADRSLDRICERREFDFVEDYSSQITVGLLFRTRITSYNVCYTKLLRACASAPRGRRHPVITSYSIHYTKLYE